VVPPGGVFSLNETVGERTEARGYHNAVIFEEGEEKPGIGGGVSQVTGTLFNAALVAGLPFLQYQTHSRPVAYLPLGRDATVAYGEFDMRFKNDTPAPLYIAYKIGGSSLTATLYGRCTQGQTVRVEVRSHHDAERHITAQLFRYISVGGKLVKSEKLGTSVYSWKKDDPIAMAAMLANLRQSDRALTSHTAPTHARRHSPRRH
jgi:vancomycin resistance protein YoaR